MISALTDSQDQRPTDFLRRLLDRYPGFDSSRVVVIVPIRGSGPAVCCSVGIPRRKPAINTLLAHYPIRPYRSRSNTLSQFDRLVNGMFRAMLHFPQVRRVAIEIDTGRA